jgi:uncharacterized protein DUF6191
MTQWGLDTLFNPAKRHMDEEKRRLQSTREEVGDSSGGKRIDLESGKVVIRREDDEATDTDEALAAAPAEQANLAGKAGKAEKAEKALKAKSNPEAKQTPAQVRARARRAAAKTEK